MGLAAGYVTGLKKLKIETQWSLREANQNWFENAWTLDNHKILY